MPFLAVLADFETFWVKTKRKKSEIVQIFIFEYPVLYDFLTFLKKIFL